MTSWKKVTDILIPMVVYYLSSTIFLIGFTFGVQTLTLWKVELFGEWVIENWSAIRVAINGIAMMIGFLFIRKTLRFELAFFEVEKNRKNWFSLLPISVLAICSSLAVNMILSYLNLSSYSKTYDQVASNQYSVPIWLGLILYGIISPIAEEALFRGIIYNKLKKYFSYVIAIFLSAFLFGAYHGNLVQGIYGGIMGLLMTLCYEWSGRFFAVVLFHSIANVTIFLISGNQNISKLFYNPVVCVIFVILSIVLSLYICSYFKRLNRKESDK